ncbi:MAG: phenylpyruvate tautomerase MIF-related protein [Gammaproteobacteria bacterium]|nr:phenylpyruvate tautomerase MIF-related protein [Gammaproteobacteria bacterium]MCW8911253.1 phenylpyruvate tautomerase MIF-related protein [Gammaproteobacteria bacterium]MCW9005069.1 phenylpyruvate tautomerase MIF-related protein [Gammaproteobacteria bacterium]
MPLLIIKTNSSIDDKNSFALEASQQVATILGKPESYVMININDNQTLIFAGSDQPAAYLELKSLGLPESQTSDISSALCAFINKKLGIDSARIYIEFSNAERHMWGWKDGTF